MLRYRLQYAKLDQARFLSHRELVTTLQRALRRASFPLTYTRGYNPRPKFSFGPPLGVGVAGWREYLDLETEEEINTENGCLQGLNSCLPAGVRGCRLAPIPPGDIGLGKLINCASYLVEVSPDDHSHGLERLQDSISRKESWLYKRPADGKVFDVAAAIIKSGLHHEEGRLFLEVLLKIGSGEAPVRGLLDVVAQAGAIPLRVTRSGLYRLDGSLLSDPLGQKKDLKLR